jgi:hypothetical protein
MSRSGYSSDCENLGLWRGAVAQAIKGRRGQALLRELADALGAMPVKELHPNQFATAQGEFCSLGVLGAKRGINMDDLGDCDPEDVARRFGIAPALAAEVMYLNDEFLIDEVEWVYEPFVGPPSFRCESSLLCFRLSVSEPHSKRWIAMRKWVAEQIKEPPND